MNINTFLLNLINCSIDYYDQEIDGYFYGVCNNNVLFLGSTQSIWCTKANIEAMVRRGFFMVTFEEYAHIKKRNSKFIEDEIFKFITIESYNNHHVFDNYCSLFVKRILIDE